MRLVRLAYTCAVCIGYGAVGWSQQEEFRLPRATVEVVVFGPFGARIENAKAQLFSAGQMGRAVPGSGLRFSNVPYGEYYLRITGTNATVSQSLLVNQRTVWARVGIPLRPGDAAWPGGFLTITGRIKQIPANAGDWWVRVAGVFLDVRRESKVSLEGEFLVGGLDMGAYVVEVFEGPILRHARTVEIDTNEVATRILIDLNDGAIGSSVQPEAKKK